MQARWHAVLFGDREDPRLRLQELFGGKLPDSGQPPAPALAWARRVLGCPNGAHVTDVAVATRLLREADPRLMLRPAVFLAEAAVRRGLEVADA
ncbi:hypothetical protein F8O01_13100 [Pseudoclavibacter chungangensis]|uniref:Uncharacterized protein n=1 Tax=Pseudoclavibacter chungangensis TaxID=587635 RepID=A0A7J5BPG4_9MICO|nr:hypothetical protein [Pseudoclavibacter chungangensis]KAB1654827.1 hypothetical protein F8O01_13100 [Pseudoclavibacter chungangensis]NYJ68050.1 hypothetical protein [Pseudoclavibacter chungangensis]